MPTKVLYDLKKGTEAVRWYYKDGDRGNPPALDRGVRVRRVGGVLKKPFATDLAQLNSP